MNFREFIEKLDKEEKLIRISKDVSRKYEIPAIMKKLDGRPLLFENVIDSEMPIVANICSSRDLVAEALGIEKKELINKIANAIDNPRKFNVSKIEYKEIEVDLGKIPILTHYEKDGGPYITSAIFVINDKKYGINSSFHRCMVIDKNKIVARVLPRHFYEYVTRGNREFAICIGNPIQVLISSAISCEIEKNEFEIANALKETLFTKLDGHVVPDSEIVMIAEYTNELHDEGPFMDLTETYDIVRKQNIIKIKKIYTKENPIYHALLPGGLEHKILMGMPKEPAIYREVSKVCKCKNVYITPGGCSWLHAIVQIKKENEDDGKKAIEAAFKGHKSLKHVFIVDNDINIENPHEVEWAFATRFQGNRDLIIKENEIGSSLDPSADSQTRLTTKIGFDLTIPFNKDKECFKKHKIPHEDDIEL